MRISTPHRGNHSEDPTHRARLQLLTQRVRRLRLIRLQNSSDELVSVLALLIAAIDRLLAELHRERQS